MSESKKSKWDEFQKTSEEFQRKRLERLRHTKDLPTPWETFPEIPRGAIGWRMGSGEDYWTDWCLWLRAIAPQERETYRARHPEPQSWQGIYDSSFQSFNREQYWKNWVPFWKSASICANLRITSLIIATVNVYYQIGWNLFKFFGNVFFSFRVVHQERMIEQGPAILAMNHESFLDPPLRESPSENCTPWPARIFSTGRWWGR